MAVAQQLDRRNSLFARHGPGNLSGANDDDDLDVLSKPILTRRKDFIDKEEEARKSPNRVLYFRRNADYDRLIEVCTRKLGDNPRNVRALLIRASSYYKKGGRLAFKGTSEHSTQQLLLPRHRPVRRGPKVHFGSALCISGQLHRHHVLNLRHPSRNLTLKTSMLWFRCSGSLPG